MSAAFDLIETLTHAVVEMQRERDSARAEVATLQAKLGRFVEQDLKSSAEVERLTNERNAALNQIDRMVTQAPPAPTVNLTDIERAARLLSDTGGPLPAAKLTPDGIRYTLRACTRPIDREALAKAINAEAWKMADESPRDEETWETEMDDHRRFADAVLRHLGAQAAQPVEQVIDLAAIINEATCSLMLTSIQALALRTIIERNLRPGFALAQPKPPEPAKLPVCVTCGRFGCGCPPAKLRIKLPPYRNASESSYNVGFNDAMAEVRALLRAQGVEVDDAS